MTPKPNVTLNPKQSPQTLFLAPVAFANAVANPPEGAIQPFTDSSTAVWGAAITVGGGVNHVLGYFNGANWTVIGK